MIKTLDITDAQRRLDELVHDVSLRKQRIIIKKRGQSWAALISPQDLERLNGFEEQHRATVAVLDHLYESFPDLSMDEVERQVGRALDNVRAEREASSPQATFARLISREGKGKA